MRLVLRLKPGDAASRAVPLAGDSLPNASPPVVAVLRSASPWPAANDSHLAPCRRCGVLNGRSASFCWSCEVDLWADEPRRSLPLWADEAFEFVAAPGPAAEKSEDPEQRSAADSEPRRSLPLVSQGGDPASFNALGDAAVPTAPAAVRTLADADAPFPVLTTPVEGNDPAASVPAAMAPRRTREIVATIVFVALVGAGTYLHFRTPARGALDATPAPTSAARAGGIAVGPESVAPTNASPAQTGPTNSNPAEGALLAVVEVPAADMHAQVVEPSDPTSVEAGPLAAAPTNHPVRVVARPKATRSATSAALAETRSGKARSTMHSVNAAAAVSVPKPDGPEPARQTSARLGPCTATVASLGLCTEHSANAAAAVSVPKPSRPELARQASAPLGPCTATVASLGLCTAPPIQSKE